MKKLLIALLAVCVLFAGFLTWKNWTPRTETAEETQPVKTIDFDAMYATHAPDEVVMRVGGKDVTWGDFFYIYHYGAASTEQAFVYYGMSVDWDLVVDEEKQLTLGEAVNSDAELQMKDFVAIETLAEKNGISIESMMPKAEEMLSSFVDSYTASGDTEEGFYAMLKNEYMDRDTYLKYIRRNLTESELFTKLYGGNAELVSDEDALRYVSDNQYAKLNHILFMCVDPATGEELDEAVQAEKLAQAEALAEELRGAENTEELLALYAQRKEELDEDTGKTAYPDGYIVTPNTQFVPEFLDGGYALGEYEVSDPVKSSYGYHVMLRLPVSADEVLDESTGSTARMLVAQEQFNKALTECSDGLACEYVNGFELPKISDYLR